MTSPSSSMDRDDNGDLSPCNLTPRAVEDKAVACGEQKLWGR